MRASFQAIEIKTAQKYKNRYRRYNEKTKTTPGLDVNWGLTYFARRINKLKVSIQVREVVGSLRQYNDPRVFAESENVSLTILLSRAIKLFGTEIAKDCSYSFKQGRP